MRVPEREDTGKSVAPRALQGRSLSFVLVRSAGYDDDDGNGEGDGNGNGDGDAAQPRNGRLRAAL